MISVENQGLVIQGGDGDEGAGEAQRWLPLVSSAHTWLSGPAGGQSCRLDKSVPAGFSRAGSQTQSQARPPRW